MGLDSIEQFLQGQNIVASAPSRVDIGGTWDIPAFALPFWRFMPATVNVAINLRTIARLEPFRKGWTRVTSQGFKPEEYPGDEAPFNTALGYVFACASYFGVTGLQIDISSESPPKSALGGSGVLGVAVLYALSKAANLRRHEELLSKERLVRAAYELESSLSISLTGMQDQAAAAYGGANLWHWLDGGQFNRTPISSTGTDISRNILVAYSGVNHDSSIINQTWIEGFLGGQHRSMWLEINENTTAFADAFRQERWKEAANYMNRETDIRRALTEDVLIPSTEKLVDAARMANCGARFTGAGAGGCVWAIGQADEIDSLRDVWRKILSGTEDGKILDVEIDTKGAL